MKRLIFIFLLSCSVANAQMTTFDAFTETSDTALASHVPTIKGTSWTESQDTCTSQFDADSSDYACPTADVANCIMIYTTSPAPSIENYDVKVNFIDAGTVTSTECVGVVGRYTDSSNYYSLGVCDDAGLNYRMYKRVAGVSTNLVTNAGGLGAGQTDVVIFRISNQNKVAIENGTQIISNTDNALTSVGSAGIWCGQVQVANDDCDGLEGLRMDNFSVYAPQIVWNFDGATDAYADDEPLNGRWYLSPVVHLDGARYAKVAVLDSRCATTSTIGDFDVPDEQALSYVDCDDYSNIENDNDVRLLYIGDIRKDKTAKKMIDGIGRQISPSFNSDYNFVRRN
jgi:hypothetical protein